MPTKIKCRGYTYQRVGCNGNLQYKVQHYEAGILGGSLIDGGANSGLAGEDFVVIEHSMEKADVTGINDHEVKDVPLSLVAGVIETQTGSFVGLFHQYAYLGQGKSIHSANQLRNFGVKVCNKPKKFGGQQQVKTPCGKVIPLSIRQGLAYMDMRPPSKAELQELPQVMFTADEPWDPSCLDNEAVYDASICDIEDPGYGHGVINDYGETLNVSAKCSERILKVDFDEIKVVESAAAKSRKSQSKEAKKTNSKGKKTCTTEARLPRKQHGSVNNLYPRTKRVQWADEVFPDPAKKEKHWQDLPECYQSLLEEKDPLGFTTMEAVCMYGVGKDTPDFDLFVDGSLYEVYDLQRKPSKHDLKRIAPNLGFVNEERGLADSKEYYTLCKS